ncbi:hypothetical protein JRQ81_014434 [Phrynocephalus forsythii]|uniref:Protein kinase domain-containing protein n=1 Tax=Phrynocephalus forsythii TaxID=171643 RepID=A0A9Q0XWQ6_9SAUR|nr:hypothetical protein JRQ81_014434 [Phrynocephalus forsythii]
MHNYVRRCKRLPEPEAAALFRQMAGAVGHCHQHGVVLRDLKLGRFIFADGERSKLLLENLEGSCVLSGPDDSLEDKHGCPAYVGPEILRSKGSYSGKAADIWSLGVALYTMLQDPPGRFALPEALSPSARCLIRCLLRKEPAERLAASEILLHPWLAAGGTLLEDSWRGPVGYQRLVQVVPEAEDLWAVEEEEEEEENEGLYG